MRMIDGNELKTAFPCGESVRTECVRATIDHMPTVEPEPHWTSCSEGLPEEKKEVLISADGELYIAEFEMINGERFWSEVVEYRYIWNVDAWMPLPPPYQPSTHCNNDYCEIEIEGDSE